MIICIKIGGRAASEYKALNLLIQEIGTLGHKVMLVHGGGAEVTKISTHFGLEARFDQGVRVTTPEEMDIVDMVLAGKMNTMLVRMFQANGIQAAGLSGCDAGLFTGEQKLPGTTSRTGSVTQVNPKAAVLLMENGIVPVISSVSMDAKGNPLNINADEAAFALAPAVKADALVFISDIPGVLKEDQVIPELTKQAIEAEIEAGVIQGGMIPKVREAEKALAAGMQKIIIGNYIQSGDLQALLKENRGTTLVSQVNQKNKPER